MNFDIINVVSVIATIIAVVITIVMIKDVRNGRKPIGKPNISTKDLEYKKITDITKPLEFERERNKGEHFDDESVYLERAKKIRENSPFFTYVNGI